MPPLSTSDVPKLMIEGLREVMVDAFDARPAEYEKIFNIKDTEKQVEEDVPISGIGLFVENTEGGSPAFDAPVQGYPKTYTQRYFDEAVNITAQVRAFDLYGPIKRLSEALGRAAHESINVQLATVFNNAFSSAAADLGPDGVSLCNTAHPLVKAGGTQANRPSTDVDLSVTGLRQGMNDFDGFVTDANHQVLARPDLVVYHRSNRWKGFELLKSDGNPESSNRTANAFDDTDLSGYMWHYLTDTNAWFILGPKEDHQLNVFWSKKFDTRDERDPYTNNQFIVGEYWMAYGWSDWRPVWGTSGSS